MPNLRALARHALPNVLEGVLLPVGIFYLFLWLTGTWGGIASSLAWSWLVIGYRLATRQRVPGLLVVGAMAMTARTGLALATNSVFIYFLQPTLGTVLMAAAFLVSVPAGRPLAARLAEDFVPMPGWLVGHPAIRRFFVRITVLWAGIQLANAAVAFWLLVSQPVGVYLAAKTVSTTVAWGAGIVISTIWFFRLLNRHNLQARVA
jgi:hypothetical protein